MIRMLFPQIGTQEEERVVCEDELRLPVLALGTVAHPT